MLIKDIKISNENMQVVVDYCLETMLEMHTIVIDLN